MKFDFEGQFIVVTGGTKGIGKAISEAFLNAGAEVLALYASDEKSAVLFKKEINSDNFSVKQCDVSDINKVEVFFNQLVDDNKKLSVLINNAGIRKDGVLAMMAKDDWQKVIDINLTGAFNMSKYAVQNMMKQRYGRIISITSPGKDIGFVGQANYAASKAGLVAMTRSLAREVAKRNITVNCVSPGFIETELIKDLPIELVKEYKKTISVKRFGKPNEVSPVVLFLASKETSYVTGSVYNVDGGI